MDETDRRAIQRNIKVLTQQVDLPLLSTALIQRGVIDNAFVERIKAKYAVPHEVAQEFFLSYTKRGPQAFQILIEVLENTGHISEAQTLRVRSSLSQNYEECVRSPRESLGSTGNGHSFALNSSSSSNSTTSSNSGSPLMRLRGSNVEPLGEIGNNSPTSSSVSLSNATEQLPQDLTKQCSLGNAEPLEIIVKDATTYNMGKSSVDDAYQMLSNPRGFALIINNIDFMGDIEAKREGAEKDSDNLRELLVQLGFEVMIRHNVRKKDLTDPETGIIKRFLDQFKEKNVDACIVAIMSHGKDGDFVRTSDPENSRKPQENYWHLHRDIVDKFNNRYCYALRGKPKVFIVQACKGEINDRGVRRTRTDGKNLSSYEVVKMETDDNNCMFQPPDDSTENEDMIIGFSTVPGYVSNRDIEFGTWYIRIVCQVFMEKAWNSDILELLNEVGRRMARIRSETGSKQMASFLVIGLHKFLYFNPGLYADATC